MGKNNNKLTFDVIEQANEKYTETKTEEIVLEVDGEQKVYEIEVYKKFSPVKIQSLMSEFVKNMEFAKNVKRDKFGEILQPYLLYLIIKHFTNLGDSMPDKLPEQLKSLQTMMDTTAFFQIVSKFDEEALDTLKEKLEILVATMEVKVKDLNPVLDEIYGDKIKSKVFMD